MKAYRDSKSAYGYKTLCDDCAKNNTLQHVFVQEGGLASPPALGKVQKCDDCNRRCVLVPGIDNRTEAELISDYKKEVEERRRQEEIDAKIEEFVEIAKVAPKMCKLCGDMKPAEEVNDSGVCADCETEG